MPSHAAELVFFHASYCGVCERWEEEVAPIYPKTPESRTLPLRRHNVNDSRPSDLAFVRSIVYTPTFVAVENGKEIGRIVGYINDDFFWSQMQGLVEKVGRETAKGAGTCPGDGLATPC
ncbi:MAG: thioredoxin family protein [Alphaproteobacteria bacterium]|nr:thioredoxin family protein [Alphaproteobacteria bacterium]MBF0251747.1 thioredoxin family protein [Alphaproteobacteria bacterium]